MASHTFAVDEHEALIAEAIDDFCQTWDPACDELDVVPEELEDPEIAYLAIRPGYMSVDPCEGSGAHSHEVIHTTRFEVRGMVSRADWEERHAWSNGLDEYELCDNDDVTTEDRFEVRRAIEADIHFGVEIATDGSVGWVEYLYVGDWR